MPTFEHDAVTSPEALAAFSKLGRSVPMIAITDIPLGPLTDFDCSAIDLKQGYIPRLNGIQDQYFYNLGKSVLSSLAGGEPAVTLYAKLFAGSDRFAEGYGVAHARHAFNGSDIQTMPAEIAYSKFAKDGRMHNDVPERNIRGTVYGMHLTTAGGGVVRAAAGIILPVESRRVIDACFRVNDSVESKRSFEAGDLHIFVRQGTIQNPTDSDPGDVVAPTSHHFISNTGGRSFIESSFGLAAAWR